MTLFLGICLPGENDEMEAAEKVYGCALPPGLRQGSDVGYIYLHCLKFYVPVNAFCFLYFALMSSMII